MHILREQERRIRRLEEEREKAKMDYMRGTPSLEYLQDLNAAQQQKMVDERMRQLEKDHLIQLARAGLPPSMMQAAPQQSTAGSGKQETRSRSKRLLLLTHVSKE